MTGPVHEVFAKLLRGLSGARITRPGHFKNAAGDGVSVRCSYKADDGQVGGAGGVGHVRHCTALVAAVCACARAGEGRGCR